MISGNNFLVEHLGIHQLYFFKEPLCFRKCMILFLMFAIREMTTGIKSSFQRPWTIDKQWRKCIHFVEIKGGGTLKQSVNKINNYKYIQRRILRGKTYLFIDFVIYLLMKLKINILHFRINLSTTVFNGMNYHILA